jgi:hypothetical protein
MSYYSDRALRDMITVCEPSRLGRWSGYILSVLYWAPAWSTVTGCLYGILELSAYVPLEYKKLDATAWPRFLFAAAEPTSQV